MKNLKKFDNAKVLTKKNQQHILGGDMPEYDGEGGGGGGGSSYRLRQVGPCCVMSSNTSYPLC